MLTASGHEKQILTASDVLAPHRWASPASRAGVGLDVACTKIAIDLQSLTPTDAETTIRADLEMLREATGTDAAFYVTYDPPGLSIQSVETVKGLLATCNPEGLRGIPLAELPGLRERLAQNRLFELRDTLRARPEQATEALLLGELNLRSVLLVGLTVRGRPRGFLGLATGGPCVAWDVNLHLMLKLVGSSLSSGLEKLALQHEVDAFQAHRALAEVCSTEGVWEYDAIRRETWFSPRWKEMFGYAAHDLNGSPDWTRLIHPDDVARVTEDLRSHVAGLTTIFESVHRVRHRDGDWRWVQSRARADIANGQLRRLTGVELDITERRLYEDALFREKERAQITLRAIGDGVITTDERSRVEYLNPVAEQLTGWSLDEAMGRPVDEVFRAFHEETCEPVESPLTEAVRRLRSVKSARPTLFIRRDGNELYLQSTASPIRDGSGTVIGGVLVFHDVSESRELNRKLSYHASHDALTGLVNRHEFEQRLDRALVSARARESAYALCVVDLDQFRIVNDTCGHSAGDALLSQVAQLLKSKIRWRDTLARLGADEFAVLLEACTLEEALRTAELLREAVAEHRFQWADRTFRLGASIGVVPLSGVNDDPASALSAANSAAQAAKEQGRNRVHCFEDNDLDLMRRRREMQWASRITTALEDGRFELYRQDILPLQSMGDSGRHYEILLRMRDEQGNVVTPDHFIAAAERYSITPAIDRWVVENTFRWLISEADERDSLAMCSINLSGQSLADDKFLPFIIDRFHKTGIDARRICFEITETAAIASYSQATRFIHALKDLGCRFALDDFGTGLSSFGYLKHFPVDFLKIDGSFVRDIHHDTVDLAMVRSINEIGHLTQKKTIAEFAENDEIIALLRDLGVDYAQGYGVARPQRILATSVDSIFGRND